MYLSRHILAMRTIQGSKSFGLLSSLLTWSPCVLMFAWPFMFVKSFRNHVVRGWRSDMDLYRREERDRVNNWIHFFDATLQVNSDQDELEWIQFDHRVLCVQLRWDSWYALFDQRERHQTHEMERSSRSQSDIKVLLVLALLLFFFQAVRMYHVNWVCTRLLPVPQCVSLTQQITNFWMCLHQSFIMKCTFFTMQKSFL